jgi:hypothetical protein
MAVEATRDDNGLEPETGDPPHPTRKANPHATTAGVAAVEGAFIGFPG